MSEMRLYDTDGRRLYLNGMTPNLGQHIERDHSRRMPQSVTTERSSPDIRLQDAGGAIKLLILRS